MKNPEFAALTDIRSVLKGLVSGSLIIGSILNDLGFAVQAVLFIIGLLIFLDSIMPFGREAFVVTTVIFAVIGGFLSLLLSLMGSGVYWIAVAVVLAVVVYLEKGMKISEKVRK